MSSFRIRLELTIFEKYSCFDFLVAHEVEWKCLYK